MIGSSIASKREDAFADLGESSDHTSERNTMIDKEKENELVENPSRRSFLEAGSAALAAATFVGLKANAQQRDNTREAEGDHSTSDPGQENKTKNSNLDRSAIARLPKDELYIFPANLPGSLAQDKAAVGGKSVESSIQYTFKMSAMAPTVKTAGGEVRIVDSHNFPASKSVAAALDTLKPGAIRELHWHPNASEWQFYLAGKGAHDCIYAPDEGSHDGLQCQ
jgi:hypothetical protein